MRYKKHLFMNLFVYFPVDSDETIWRSREKVRTHSGVVFRQSDSGENNESFLVASIILFLCIIFVAQSVAYLMGVFNLNK